jgi:MYXO-CTERM domain-containing protein
LPTFAKARRVRPKDHLSEAHPMKISVLSTSLLVLALGAGGAARATDYYVSPTGSDSAAGTMAAPWATLQKGATTAVAGDTVWIRGGTYAITTPATSGGGINFTKSGTASANINYFAYQGEHPKFDFTNLVISTTGYTMGFTVSGSYLHFKGLEICCVPMNTFSNNGISVTGSAAYDTFEQLDMHGNSGNGIFIGNKSGGGHLVLNCDAHDNYDATSNQGQGQNADGFGIHYQTSGATSTIRGCRAWWNSDDGYDLINQEIPVTVENSWAMMNGYAMYGTYSPTSGNGNGFKMGSSKTGVRHLVQNNVAWKNKANGFYANHSTGGNNWYNNTSFMNGTNYNMLASSFDSSGNVVMTITLTGALAHVMRNNIGYPKSNQNMDGVDTMFNTWDLNITPASSDFASISDPSVSMTGMQIEGMGALGPRQADGSLPNVDFMHLSAASRMIDKGTDVGLPYVGAAPDLGAYEYGATSTGGSSGTTGAGGSTGAGGTTTTGTGSAGTGGTTATGSGGSGAAGKAGSSGSGGATGTGGATTGTGGTGTVASGGVSGGSGGTPGGSGGVSGGSGGSPGSGGDSSGSGGTPDGSGGASATGSGGTASGEAGSSGCSCAVDAPAGGASLLGALGALALVLRRSRRRRSA